MQSQDEKSAEIKLPAKVVPIGPVRVQLSRQQLRRMGRLEAKFRVETMLSHRNQPVLSRRERRKAQHDAHRAAWEARDRELVARIRAGFTPEDKTNGEIPGHRD